MHWTRHRSAPTAPSRVESTAARTCWSSRPTTPRNRGGRHSRQAKPQLSPGTLFHSTLRLPRSQSTLEKWPILKNDIDVGLLVEEYRKELVLAKRRGLALEEPFATVASRRPEADHYPNAQGQSPALRVTQPVN